MDAMTHHVLAVCAGLTLLAAAHGCNEVAATPLDRDPGNEAGASEDGATDAGVDAQPFCSGRDGRGDGGGGGGGGGGAGGGLWCLDFDDGNPYFQWSPGVDRYAGAEPVFDEAASTSPPKSMRTAVPSTSAGGDYARSYITRIFPRTPKRVHAEVDVRLACPTPKAAAGNVVVLGIDQRIDSDAAGFALGTLDVVLDEDKAVVVITRHVDARGPTTERLDLTMPTLVATEPPRWQHLVLDAVYSDTQGSVRMQVDDAVVLDKKGIATSSGAYETFVNVGLFAQGGTDPCTVSYDNVLVDWD